MTIQVSCKRRIKELARTGDYVLRKACRRRPSGHDTVQPEGKRYKSSSRTELLSRATGTTTQEDLKVAITTV